MKIEVEYEVIEVTKYRVTRKYRAEGGDRWSVGHDADDRCGEFSRREDAERVAKALDAAVAQEARKHL